MSEQQLLDTITNPHQLRRLSEPQLEQLAEEIRGRIVETVSRCGGHLASNLGVADLTVALHYVFDFARDRLLWDVGHQCYPHKLLTGRWQRFDSLRQAGGISGYPDPRESEYDLFATGHAGTSIPAAAGLAHADQQAGRDTKVVAVVGDASIANGVALEGINNAALLKRQFLVILNDNAMAIDHSHGALAGALDRVRLTHAYSDFKTRTEQLLNHLPLGQDISEALRHVRAGLRATLHGAQVFEALGFSYYGPVDGHDVRGLIRLLPRLAEIDRPVLLHVHTQKGRGCEYAVEDPCRFHSPSAYRVENGQAIFPPRKATSWTQVFAESLKRAAREDERIVAITAAMPDGTGLADFREEFPDRTLDVGMSESHAVAAAAGMAKGGLRPVVAVYSTFMQRAFDQAFHDVALQHLPVTFCLDRAGLVGSDGPTHHGLLDIAYLRPLPGMVLMAPADADEMDAAMKLAVSLDSPSVIRYPKDAVPSPVGEHCPPFEPGKARIVREGEDATIVGYGATVAPALEAARQLAENDGLEVCVISARFAKPLDQALLTKRIAAGRPVLLAEDHAIAGGFGSAVLEMAAERGLNTSNVRLAGVSDRFIPHARRCEQLQETGLTADEFAGVLREMVGHHRAAVVE
ncbi:MAG: 1-deoxy-D-xylulose-5-phosphate synthase [Phycisphaerae bacterium]